MPNININEPTVVKLGKLSTGDWFLKYDMVAKREEVYIKVKAKDRCTLALNVDACFLISFEDETMVRPIDDDKINITINL